MKTYEVNFDGLVGPTHNYSGLSHGNVASMSHRALESNPQMAVLQGLSKMKNLMGMGLKQALLPPHERPHLDSLRAIGFSGTDADILKKAQIELPDILPAVSSGSNMWTANAATVSPSADTADHKVHFTPANLISKFHRSIETPTTGRILKRIFTNDKYFVHHSALPSAPAFGDEGAANHTRLCADYGTPGLEFFVYGRHGLKSSSKEPRNFPARQTWEASKAVSQNHLLNSDSIVFAQQNPAAIDAGVFHNDVAGVGNKNVYFCHGDAYLDNANIISELKRKFVKTCGQELHVIQVPSSKISMEDSVKSYLFNSQLISLPSGKMALILPEECKNNPSVHRYLQELMSEQSEIESLIYLDLHQSMRNGGGPACLRLRVVMNENELAASHQGVYLTDKLFDELSIWAKENYRDRLSPDDLADPLLLVESRTALDQLTQILKIGSVYSFQKIN